MYSLLRFIRTFAAMLGLSAFMVSLLIGAVYPHLAIPSLPWTVMSLIFGLSVFALSTTVLFGIEYYSIRKNGLHWVAASYYDIEDMLNQFKEMGVLDLFLGVKENQQSV